ncbi:MAG: sensor histidine kinase [Clostridium sp.]
MFKIGVEYLGCSLNAYGRITFLFELVESLIAIIISYFVGKLLYKHDLKSVNLKKVSSSKFALLIYFVVIISAVLLTLCIFDGDSSNFETTEGMFAIFYIIIMFVIIGILVYMSIKESKIEKQRIQYESLKEYTDKLELLYTDMRKFRHDYINILSSMYSFIEEGDMCGLKKYFDEKIQPLNQKMNSNNYKLVALKNVHLPEVKGLLSSKIIKAQELGLDTFIDISEPIDEINIDILELVISLGIIMDNAIEAALSSEDKRISLGLIKKNQSVIIIVSNSFSGDIPSISMLFKQGFSTKGENRGLGLSNLKEIIDKYKNVTLDTFIKNELFFQEITIKNRK